MALNDMYEIVHRFTQGGKKMTSVFHVLRDSPVETALSVQDSFQFSILPSIRALQSDTVTNDELFVFNLGLSTDFGTFTLTAALGNRPGARSPSFVSGAVRFPSIDRDIRSGQKRFAGMLETDYTAGLVTAGALTLLNDIGDAMIGTWLSSIDGHDVATYAVIGRVCDEEDPVTGVCLKYRLPKTDPELKFYIPTQRVTNSEISSQVSRKVF